MSLKRKIIDDLSNALKAKAQTNNLKVIVGEIQRLPNKYPEDNEVVEVLQKLAKDERKNLRYIGATTSEYLRIVESYIPKLEMASEEEIIKWIQDQIVLESFKNKFASIKVILGHFGDRTNGAIVKKILTEKF